MKRSLLALLMVLVLVIGSAGTASAAQPVQASGDFVASIDFTTVSFTPVGANCLLEVAGQFTFSGELEGGGSSLTRALILAPCDDVAVTPPGTFRDVFSAHIEFSGTLGGVPVTAGVHYHGTVEEGGAIRGVMNFSGDLRGGVRVDGQAAVGGTYDGTIVLK
jgi:hypothetical protein